MYIPFFFLLYKPILLFNTDTYNQTKHFTQTVHI